MPKPYYEEDGIILYNNDCRDVLPQFADKSFDLVLTDPPYLGYKNGSDYFEYVDLSILRLVTVKQYVFWDAIFDFPLDFTAIHIWYKPNATSFKRYERIFERNGNKPCGVFNVPVINYKNLPEWVNHPTQKPLRLIKRLAGEFQFILDPFCGSGTTLVAAKQLGRKAVGIEISEVYCKIAVSRLQQMELFT